MTEFTALMSSMTRSGDGWAVSVSDDWLQGRTRLWRSGRGTVHAGCAQ